MPPSTAGKILGYYLITYDITATRNAQNILMESHQQLNDMIDFMPDATFIIDKQGKVVTWNKANDILGKGNYEYALPFYGERRPILIDLVLRPQDQVETEWGSKYGQLAREDKILIGEAFTPALHGKETYLLATAARLHNYKEELIGAIECVRNITERRPSGPLRSP